MKLLPKKIHNTNIKRFHRGECVSCPDMSSIPFHTVLVVETRRVKELFFCCSAINVVEFSRLLFYLGVSQTTSLILYILFWVWMLPYSEHDKRALCHHRRRVGTPCGRPETRLWTCRPDPRGSIWWLAAAVPRNQTHTMPQHTEPPKYSDDLDNDHAWCAPYFVSFFTGHYSVAHSCIYIPPLANEHR